jgi:hypothetical protein
MLSSSVDPNDKNRANKTQLVLGFFEKPLSISHIQSILEKASD